MPPHKIYAMKGKKSRQFISQFSRFDSPHASVPYQPPSCVRVGLLKGCAGGKHDPDHLALSTADLFAVLSTVREVVSSIKSYKFDEST